MMEEQERKGSGLGGVLRVDYVKERASIMLKPSGIATI